MAKARKINLDKKSVIITLPQEVHFLRNNWCEDDGIQPGTYMDTTDEIRITEDGVLYNVRFLAYGEHDYPVLEFDTEIKHSRSIIIDVF